MAINFPTSPSNGDLYSAVGRTWQYDSSASAWKSLSESDVTLTGLGVENLDQLTIDSNGEFGQALVPNTDVTYDLGSSSKKWKDLYLSGSSIQLGTRQITQDNIPDVNLSIAPEVLEIQVAAPAAGQDTAWLWTWEQSTLPYARRTINNSPEVQVPLYKQGTYTVNNFAAYSTHAQMTQTHSLYLKWIDGAGTDNLVSWATSAGPISDSHPEINGGNATDVQRISVNVPSTITPPTLTAPSVSYTVSNNANGAYTFSGSAEGDNPNLGPLYKGGTYTFNVSATGHPFYLTTDNGTNFSAGTYFGEYTTGVTGSRTDSGTVTFTVPSNAPDTLYYQCGNHGVMRGAITVKDLAVETNNNGNYIVYFQHTQEGHKTPVELRPIPSLVNQMCLVYDAGTNKFVPQDLATYVENTPSFENKIREVAGTAELVVEDGSAVVAKVNVYDDSTYLPLTGNNAGDQAFATDNNILYIWDGSAWQQAGTTNSDDLTEGTTNLFYTNERVDDRVAALVIGGNNITATYDDAAGTLTIDGQPGYTNSDVATYLSNNGYDTATNIIATITDSAPATLDTLNELAAALGDDPNFATTTANNIALKAPIDNPTFTGTITGNGSGLTNVPSGINRFNYTATAGQTTYAATYTTGAVDVFVNGIKLTRTTDFDDTSGTSIVLTTASVVGEIVEINSYNTYTSADAVSASGGGTFAGLVTLDNSAIVNTGTGTSDPTNTLQITRPASSDYSAISFRTAGVTDWSIGQNATGGLEIYEDGADAATRLHISNGGNIGIGTKTPASPLGANYSSLDINSGVWGGTVNFSGNNGGYIGNRHSGNNGLGYYSAAAHSFAVSGATAASLTITSEGDVGIGATNPGGSRLYLQDTHTTTVSDGTTLIGNTTLTINGNSSQGSDVMRMGPMGTAGRYFIDVSNSSGNASYDLLINPFNNGNVGINTNNPTETLSVVNNTSSSYTPTNYNGNATLTLKTPNAVSNYSGVRYTNTAGNYEWYAGSNQVGSNSADFVFQGYDRSAGGYKEMMRLKDSGAIDTPQQPACMIYCQAPDINWDVGDIIGYGTGNSIKAFDTTNSFNMSNHTYTAPEDGKYYVSFTANGVAMSNQVPRAYPRVNGSDLGRGQHARGNSTISGDLDMRTYSGIIPMSANDTLNVYVGVGRWDTFGCNYFCVYKML